MCVIFEVRDIPSYSLNAICSLLYVDPAGRLHALDVTIKEKEFHFIGIFVSSDSREQEDIFHWSDNTENAVLVPDLYYAGVRKDIYISKNMKKKTTFMYLLLDLIWLVSSKINI